MSRHLRGRLAIVFKLLAGILAALLFCWFLWYQPRYRDHPFRQELSGLEKKEDWLAFGGTWELVDGIMRNDSDERGAKIMNGSPQMQNYLIEADVQLLGQYGDAGLIVRASNEEEGVDAYDGYYAGLRDLDNTLILGRADHGWREYQARPIPPRVYAQQWYHLKVLAYECDIIASSTSVSGQVTVDAVEEPGCIRTGRFGLKSYQTGGLWRNVRVRPATYRDVLNIVGDTKLPVAVANKLVGPIGYPVVVADPSRTTGADAMDQYFEPMYLDMRDHHVDPNGQPIASLRVLPPDKPVQVTIHGVVTLTSPVLFVQDSTGGVAIQNFRSKISPQIGDQVEAKGDAELQSFSSILKDADVHVLWSHTPIPPIAVTASQAATGSYDAQYIAVEGRLVKKEAGLGRTVILTLAEGNQSFRAIVRERSNHPAFERLKDKSRLHLRGICVVDAAYTEDITPFALLLPSINDVQILEGPPWWSTGHIVATVIGLLLLVLVLQTLYSYIERWRLRAVLEERERLAHEMHDTLAQSFAGIGFQLQAIRDEVGNKSAALQQLDLARDLVRNSHEEARRNIAALRPEILDSVGLLTALADCARRMVQGGSVEVIACSSGEMRSIPLRISDTVFRIGLEAISNTIRHAEPTELRITTSYEATSLELLVEDNGKGFSPDENAAGFGIRGMGKRADSISAELQIRSKPGKGTRVRVVVMLPPKITSSSWPKYAWHFLWEHRFHGQTHRKDAYQATHRG